MKIAIVGSNGIVGETILSMLLERGWNTKDIIKTRRKGKPRKGPREFTLEKTLEMKPDYAIFAVPYEVSEEWVRLFVTNGATVIDKSEYSRELAGIPMVVPEINSGILTAEDTLISTPNCVATQLSMVLPPLKKKYQMEEVLVTSLQSASGSGRNGLTQLRRENDFLGRNSNNGPFPKKLFNNLIPQCGKFKKNGATTEEEKVKKETRRILRLRNLSIRISCIRVPIEIGHSLDISIRFKSSVDLEEILDTYKGVKGLVLCDPKSENKYQTPNDVSGNDEVSIGRIRMDGDWLKIWSVTDNLRKGAALNAIQIMEHMMMLRGQRTLR